VAATAGNWIFLLSDIWYTIQLTPAPTTEDADRV